MSDERFTPQEAAEMRRAYLVFSAEHGEPHTWTIRSEVFLALLDAVEHSGFSQEDVHLLTWSDRHTVAGSEADKVITAKRANLAARIAALLPPEKP